MRQRGEGDLKIEAEIRAMYLETKDHHQKLVIFPQSLWGKRSPADTLISDIVPTTVKE